MKQGEVSGVTCVLIATVFVVHNDGNTALGLSMQDLHDMRMPMLCAFGD